MPQALSNLPVGAKVKFGKYQVNTEDAQPIVWTIVAKNHQCTPAYPENAITLHATEILDLRCFDAKEPDNNDSDRQSYGNNRYSVSNIDQWLNKDSAAGEWYVAAHDADHSPDTSDNSGNYNTQYADKCGFLNAFSIAEKAAILLTTIRIAKPSIDGGSHEDIERKVFLPSVTEVEGSKVINIAEGANWGYYTTAYSRRSPLTQQCFINTTSSYKPSSQTTSYSWWLRSPIYGRSSYAQDGDGSGNISEGLVVGSWGIRPALNLSSTLMVSDTTDDDSCYTFVWTSPTDYTFTLNGTQYTNVARINYVSGNTTREIKKLVVNGSTVWQA